MTTTRGYSQAVRISHGLFTQREAAEAVGMAEGTFYALIHRKTLPKPSAQLHGSTRRYYTAADLEYIRRLIRA